MSVTSSEAQTFSEAFPRVRARARGRKRRKLSQSRPLATAQVHSYFTDEKKESLRRHCRRLGISMSVYVRIKTMGGIEQYARGQELSQIYPDQPADLVADH